MLRLHSLVARFRSWFENRLHRILWLYWTQDNIEIVPFLPLEWSLLRYCSLPVQVVPDARNGGFKISTQAFKPRKNEAGVSIDIEELRLRSGFVALSEAPSLMYIIAVLRLTVKSCADVGLRAEHRPVRRDVLRLRPPNPFHGELLGHASPKGLKKLRDGATFAVPLDQAQAGVVHERLKRFNIGT